jgi:hypothetical protein
VNLWIIDWGWAGFYPSWFECATMLRQNEVEESRGSHHAYWEILILFICGPCFKQDAWLRRIAGTVGASPY